MSDALPSSENPLCNRYFLRWNSNVQLAILIYGEHMYNWIQVSAWQNQYSIVKKLTSN